MSFLAADNAEGLIGSFPNDGLGIGFVPIERSFGGGAGCAGGVM